VDNDQGFLMLSSCRLGVTVSMAVSLLGRDTVSLTEILGAKQRRGYFRPLVDSFF